MKLISMTDFVLGTESNLDKHNPIGLGDDIQKRYVNIIKYAQFLKQPLTLGMFVPCDEDDNVLVEPLHYKEWCKKMLNVPYCLDLSKYEQYQQAKERVLFEFQYEYLSWDNSDMENNTIEDLLTDGYDYTLTPQALKQIGI